MQGRGEARVQIATFAALSRYALMPTSNPAAQAEKTSSRVWTNDSVDIVGSALQTLTMFRLSSR